MSKSVILMGTAVFVLGLAASCYAGSIGPVEPLGAMKVRLDGEYNGIFDRDIDSSGAMTGGEIQESHQGYAKLAVGINDWANVYAKLGVANLEQKLNWNVPSSYTIEYEYGPLWGIGGNALHNFGNNFGIGTDVQFNMWFTDADSISGTNSPTFINKGSLKNWDFQTALYVTYTYEVGAEYKIIPYAGGYYSNFQADIDDTIRYQDSGGTQYTVGDSEAEDNLGILVGMNVQFSENMAFNLEGRFIAETAATVGASYKF